MEIVLSLNEKKRYYEIYISPIKEHRRKQIAQVLIINDITDLKLAREKIDKQKHELVIMNEREKLVRDLHDNLGQMLCFSSIQIQAICQEMKKENYELARKYLKRLVDIINKAHKDMREYIYNIRNDCYYKKDFVFLLENEINIFEENYKFDVELIIGEETLIHNLDVEEKFQLIHIIKEALTNILKYAEADHVRICFNKKGNKGELIIEDNGKGITTPGKSGFGLNIMNERAKLIGGVFKIESYPGRGTKIIVGFPINDRGENSADFDC